MTEIETIDGVFARSIYVKSKALNTLELQKKERLRIMESITDDIRKYTDLIKPSVSRNAKIMADSIGINLTEMSWHDQNKFDKSRTIFHYEHFTTVKTIREYCLNAKNEDDIKRILLTDSKVVWILKEEDKRLSALGYRSNRKDPVTAYKEAEIDID